MRVTSSETLSELRGGLWGKIGDVMVSSNMVALGVVGLKAYRGVVGGVERGVFGGDVKEIRLSSVSSI